MDIWVAAAAAGAGYLAKYLKNVKESRRLPDSSLENSDNNKSKCTSSLARNLDHKRVKLGRVDSIDRNVPFRWVRRKSEKQTSSNVEEDETCLDAPISDVLGSSTIEKVSTSGIASEMPRNLAEHGEENVLSLLNLCPSFSRNENNEEDSNRRGGIGNFVDKSGSEANEQANLVQVGGGYRFGRGRSSLNSKRSHGYSHKPLSSFESCAMVQLCKVCVDTEEYDLISHPLPSAPIVRPFSVSDNRITRNLESTEDPLSLQSENGVHRFITEDRVDLSVKDTLIGFLPPFEVGLVELQKKSRRRRVKLRQQISHMSDTKLFGEHFYLQGSPDGVLLFCLGIGIGGMSAILSNRSEVEKLNELLRQTQNLVQDLHEELDMKDSLTVKELAHDDCRFQELNESSAGITESIGLQPYQGSTAISPVQGAPMISKCYYEKEHNQKEGENSESLSRIEAELEAELARLELNIKTSDLGRMSDFDELDTDFMNDVVHGELKANMVSGAADSDQDACGSSTTHVYPTNYAVSPRELSLRLHELIESRLEERIAELESALEDSQKQLHLMEAEQVSSLIGFSSSEIGSLSTHESPTVMEHANSMSPPPLILNLSDNALTSYDEAYAEFVKISNIKKENTSKQANNKGAFALDPIPYRGWAGNGDNGSLLHLEIDERKSSEIGESNDDDGDDEEELGKLLIKQIVEKTRQGSPLVQNAQRMLFSMDE